MALKSYQTYFWATRGRKRHCPILMILGVDDEFKLLWPSGEYQPDAPAEGFPFRRKDLRRPSLAQSG